jgi:perosamine synthetase
MKNRKFIPVCEPLYLGNEEKYVLDAVRSRWISSSGEYITKFEKRFSNYCGMEYGITTTSGTTALHLSLTALGIKEGDEVIIPDFTMVAVLFAVLYCGAKPVFIDVEPDTWNIDVKKIEEKITPRTKAILVVHTYGHPVDMDPVLKLSRKYKLYTVEDAAEAHGAEYKGKKCGGIGHIGCFSFYANKIITTGEGGMVVTRDSELANRCRYYKNLCFPMHGKRAYVHDDLGYNYRMTNIQAALGLAQLENIGKFSEKRRKNANLYNKLLENIPGLQCPAEKRYAKNAYWMYGIIVNSKKFGMTRDLLMKGLDGAGVETRLFFEPLHGQGVLEKLGLGKKGSYPVTEWLSQNGLYLPSGSGLGKKDIEYICKKIKELHEKAAR